MTALSKLRPCSLCDRFDPVVVNSIAGNITQVVLHNVLTGILMQDPDYIYYAHAGKLSLARRLAGRARRKIYDDFINRTQAGPNTSILDVGVSDVENAEANMLEKMYPYLENVTCAGLGDGAALTARYQRLKYKRIIPGEPLPFDDNQFDIATSNAVIEHVGGYSEQIFHLQQMARVAKQIFITFPNRFFPVEHHTGVPLLHYMPYLFRKIIGRTALEHWGDSKNLEFLSCYHIKRIWPLTCPVTVFYTGLKMGLLSSNCAIHAYTDSVPPNGNCTTSARRT